MTPGAVDAVLIYRTLFSPLDADALRLKVRQRAADLRGVLKRSIPEVRTVLAQLAIGELEAEPMVVDGRRGYRLTGNINVAGLLPDPIVSELQAGMSNSPFVVAPTGFEPCFQPVSARLFRAPICRGPSSRPRS